MNNARRNVEPDPQLVENLIGMGFPENRVKRALKHFDNSFE